MAEVFLNVRYGLGQTVFKRDFSPLTPKLLKRVRCLRGAFAGELVITNQNLQVPERILAAALSRIRSGSPVICAANIPLKTEPQNLGEAVAIMKKHLARETERYGGERNRIGVSLEAEDDLLDQPAGGWLRLSFCPYFGLSFQVRLLLRTAEVVYLP